MRFREVPVEDLSLNPMTMIGGGWCLKDSKGRKHFLVSVIGII